jgi:hypothetical protein
MSRTIVTPKARHLAEVSARQALGYGPHDFVRPEDKRDLNIERARALRTVTQGRTYYTAASFPIM